MQKLICAPKIKGLIEAECYHTKLLIAKKRRLGFAVTPDQLENFMVGEERQLGMTNTRQKAVLNKIFNK